MSWSVTLLEGDRYLADGFTSIGSFEFLADASVVADREAFYAPHEPPPPDPPPDPPPPEYEILDYIAGEHFIRLGGDEEELQTLAEPVYDILLAAWGSFDALRPDADAGTGDSEDATWIAFSDHPPLDSEFDGVPIVIMVDGAETIIYARSGSTWRGVEAT